MYRFFPFSALAVFIGLLPILTACQLQTAQESLLKSSFSTVAAYQQSIIKFRDAAFHCTPDGIARLAAQTGLRLELVRPMSGGACVITINQRRDSPGDFSLEYQLLRQHPAIEWAEPDAVMKKM